ncbi:hypothetical protein UFOVP435_52 [uncultured Caudovirales phage]|uniref:Uncharacterized protein n=1 Tax=uncultured Caudovirales phage TaxID=2100421 RepID=A0A6J5MA99_9CAUD|nr:hypothetical protein UFOVP435_52 [uncultured Caudovirales phage]
MTITIAEVIEQCAELCDGYDTCDPKHIAKAIRALAAQYEGCIVAESPPRMWVPSVLDVDVPLYRAREMQR